MPVISPCPMGFSHSRSAYLTRVAVKTGLFATCFKTLPSSPSSHLQSHSWCSVNSDGVEYVHISFGSETVGHDGYAVVGNCFETAFQIHHVDIGAVLGKIFLISPPNSAAANDKVRGRAGYVLHFVNDLLYGRIVYCSRLSRRSSWATAICCRCRLSP